MENKEQPGTVPAARLRWAGHLQRMSNNEIARRIMERGETETSGDG